MVRASVRETLLARADDGVLWPAYDGHCVHRTVPTAMAALGTDVGPQLPAGAQPVAPGTVDRVLFVLVDGYPLHRWTADPNGLTERFDADGTVTPLTSVYPSETAAAIPSIHLGTPPATHGSIGWDQYVDRAGTVVQTLPFSAGGRPAGEAGVEPADLFVGESVYAAASEAGVRSRFVVPEGVAGSPASRRCAAGAEQETYDNVAEMAHRARRHLTQSGTGSGATPTFVYCYLPEVDRVAHTDGVDSAPNRAQRRLVAHAVGHELLDRLDPTVAERTLVVLTADHGIHDTTGATDLRSLPAVWENRRVHDGEPVPPVGSGRNVHLHLTEGTVETARAAVESAVDCATFTREAALDGGLFGPDPGERIRERCGDLVVVPRETILWHDPAKLDYVGVHGGLTPAEMLVPFAVGRASALQR
jgi:hypothetical protein